MIKFDSYSYSCYNIDMINNNFIFNWPLVGNTNITEFLSKSITNNNIAGSYIFCGPADLGKTTTANYFAKALICASKAIGAGKLPCGGCSSCKQFEKGLYSDYYLIEKDLEKKNISIEQIREFIRKLGMASFLNSYKIGVIRNAECLSIEAANALLKTLEEPQARVVAILITSHLDALPDTILSRSQIFEFKPVKTDLIYDYLLERGAKRSQAKDLARLSAGRPALAVKFLENQDFYNEYLASVKAFLRLPQSDINERLALVENLIGKTAGQESAGLACGILEIWRGAARDLLLKSCKQDYLTRNFLVIEEMEKCRINTVGLLALFDNLELGKKYLSANVNPKLVLENIAVNLC